MATMPETLWNALMDREMTKQYWGRHTNVSDWTVGSTWTHQDYYDGGIVDIVGKVVERTPPRCLVLNWVFPPTSRTERRAHAHDRVGLRCTASSGHFGPDLVMKGATMQPSR
jgi:uncharacterized protein YndB with AHSA1/START domain